MFDLSRRFVFVHIPKTAGTSLKEALVGYDLDPRSPARVSAPRLHGHPTLVTLKQEVTGLVGPHEAASFFCFTFVRCPWDRLVSLFHYLQAGGSGSPRDLLRASLIRPYRGRFGDFVVEGLGQMMTPIPALRPQVTWCGAEGPKAFNFVGRFERLADDVNALAPRIGLNRPVRLPHLRPSRHDECWSYYNDTTARIVGETYAEDAEAFGYRNRLA